MNLNLHAIHHAEPLNKVNKLFWNFFKNIGKRIENNGNIFLATGKKPVMIVFER
jgi:hypothetical protein